MWNNQNYSFDFTHIRLPLMIDGKSKKVPVRALYMHPTRGTVVFENLEKEYIVYVFRGNPSTTPDMIKKFLGIN